jgi:hypothetical protein
MAQQQPATFGQVVGLVNKLQQICTQLGDTAGNSILVDKLSSIVVVGGQVSFLHRNGPAESSEVQQARGPTVKDGSCCRAGVHVLDEAPIAS